ELGDAEVFGEQRALGALAGARRAEEEDVHAELLGSGMGHASRVLRPHAPGFPRAPARRGGRADAGRTTDGACLHAEPALATAAALDPAGLHEAVVLAER